MMLSSTGYLLESEVGGRHARAHANRIRKISSSSKETGDPREGVFPESLRFIGKICGERRGHDGNGQDVRWLKVKPGGRAAPCYTKTGDLPPAVVKIWDARREGRRKLPISSAGLNRESYLSSGLGMRPIPAPVTLEAQAKGVQSSLNERNEEESKKGRVLGVLLSPPPSNAHCAGRGARGICAGTTGRSEAGGIALGRRLAKEGHTGGARTAIGGEEGQAWAEGIRARKSRSATGGLRAQEWAKRRLAGCEQGFGSGGVIAFRGWL